MISSIKNSKDQRTPTNLKTKMKHYPLSNHEEITRTKASTSLPMVHYLKKCCTCFPFSPKTPHCKIESFQIHCYNINESVISRNAINQPPYLAWPS